MPVVANGTAISGCAPTIIDSRVVPLRSIPNMKVGLTRSSGNLGVSIR